MGSEIPQAKTTGDGPSPTSKSSNETSSAEADAAFRALAELFADPKMRGRPHHRYVLVQRETGELVLEHDPACLIVDKAIADACGLPKGRPRVIRLDRPRRKRSRPQS